MQQAAGEWNFQRIVGKDKGFSPVPTDGTNRYQGIARPSLALGSYPYRFRACLAPIARSGLQPCAVWQ